MKEPVAIIGMACVFPGAPDLDGYWRNLAGGVDAITDVPPGRWDPVFYDPSSRAVDRLYCRRGGFIDAHATVDLLASGVMPAAADGTEPDQLLALEAATKALADAGYRDRRFPRERTAVVLGRGNYQTAGMTRLDQIVRAAQQLAENLRTLVPGISDAVLDDLKTRFQAQAGSYGPDSAIGLVPNLTASRIANRLDLKGPAYTVDAACASSLVAVDQACRDLADERTDLAICGGVHVAHEVTFWSVFCQLGALSRSQQIRPFAHKADGLLLGEGIGILVLKRLRDAEKSGDRIYAVIRGAGISSDGGSVGLMTPSVDGQLLALERAWSEAGIEPSTVALIEAHGTGTLAGDQAELASLQRFFGGPVDDRPRAVLGSVKSMIGHAMPAAGAAGLIKTALALYHGVLPPSLHCDEPHPALSATRFRVLPSAEPWERNGHLRRAGVSAFGFGGIDAHVVLEAHDRGSRPAVRRARGMRDTPITAPESEELIVLAADSSDGLIRSLDEGPAQIGSGSWRLALVNPTPERVALARSIIARGKPRRGRDGLWFSPSGLASAGGLTAFLFPGVEAAFEPRVDDVARHFELRGPDLVQPGNLEQVGAAIVSVGRLLNRALAEIGIRPDIIAGHSIGEWTGMMTSGILSDGDADGFIASLSPGSLEVPDLVFAAAGCDADRAGRALQGLDGVAISHDNCPHQIILCGPEQGVDTALGRLRAEAVICQKLPFRSGFHSHAFTDYLQPHRDNLSRLRLHPPQVPFLSATTCTPYPEEADAIRALALDHLTKPVQFRRLVLALYEKGVRLFVQVGTGSLTSFVEDTLRDREHFAMTAASSERPGMSQLRRLAGALFVEGLAVDFTRLGVTPRRTAAPRRTLNLGVPLVRLRESQALTSAAALAGPAPSADPVLAAFQSVLRDVAAAQESVFQAWQRATAAKPAPRPAPATQRTIRRVLSVDAYPALRDHCLFPQPNDWAILSDRYPVVPLTTSIAMLIEAAREFAPNRVVVSVEDVRAHRWTAVEPPVEVAIAIRTIGSDRLSASIEGYLDATLQLADAYPPAPPREFALLTEEAPPPVTMEEFYRDRWMFHGPSYQGVVGLGPIARDGIRGVLVANQTPGALLDNAGQLLGFLVMFITDRDRLAMPVKVQRLELFGPEPSPGERLDCTVRLRRLDPASVLADIELVSAHGVWGRVTGWEDRRFEMDEALWRVIREPERHALAVPCDGGYVFLHDRWRTAATREFLMRRYLGERERAEYDRIALREQRRWLSGRIAAKDAVRHWLWGRGHGALFPVEISLANQPGGGMTVHGPFSDALSVSIAQKNDAAVAFVAVDRQARIELTDSAGEPRQAGGVPVNTRVHGEYVVAWTAE
jgi:acyl transferase domain-containing protein